MMPPSFTRSSPTDWMKQAWGAGRLYESGDGWSSPVFSSTYQKPWDGPVMPYSWLSPVLNHWGEFGAAIWWSSM